MSDAPLSTYLDDFLVARRYAPESRRHRTGAVTRFCREVGDPAPKDLTPALCLQWWATLAHLKPATATSYLRAVQQFLLHLRDLGVLDGDPLRSIRVPKQKRFVPKVLSPDEVDKVMAICKLPRDRCVAALMLGCGLRSVDVAKLRIEDIDFSSGLMTVRGKGDHADLLPMPEAVMEAITVYLDSAPGTEGPLVRPLFNVETRRRPEPTAPMVPFTIERRMLELMKNAGVKHRPGDGLGPHAMRRTFATTLLENGANVRTVQVLLRHESLSSTERYLRRPEAAQMRSVIETGPLSAGLTAAASETPDLVEGPT